MKCVPHVDQPGTPRCRASPQCCYVCLTPRLKVKPAAILAWVLDRMPPCKSPKQQFPQQSANARMSDAEEQGRTGLPRLA